MASAIFHWREVKSGIRPPRVGAFLMIAAFDIFKTDGNGDLLWLEAVPDLDTAKARVREMGPTSPGKYIILSQKTGNKLSVEVDRRGKLFGPLAE
jgi:hypothetical protein